jgi:hypothetical protein
MAQTPPPGIDPVPTPEIQRGDRATFSDRVDAFISWLVLAVTQFAALAANVYANAVDAFNNATSAAEDAETALNAAQSASDSASIAAVSATGLTATSTSSLAIGTGSKAFTVPIGKSFVPGIRVTAVNPSNPAQYMSGTVTSYSGTTLTVTVDIVGGSGTVATWNISVTGQRGADGAMGPAGGVAGGSLTGALNFRQADGSINVTAAPDIWGGNGNFVALTGTGTITGFTAAPQSGATRVVLNTTDGVVLTTGANLIVYGGTRTLVAGDILDVLAEGSTTKFRVTVRRRDGLAMISPAQTMTVLGSATISAPVANIDFLNIFAADYDFYKIVLYNVARDASADNLMLRLAKAGAVDAGTFYVASASTTSSINLGNLSNSLSRSASGEISIVATAAALQAVLPSVLFMVNGGTSVNHFAEGRAYINGPSSGFRLYWSLGANFVGGTVRVYGIRNVAGVV